MSARKARPIPKTQKARRRKSASASAPKASVKRPSTTKRTKTGPKKQAEKAPRRLSVRAATDRDIRAIAGTDPDLARGGLAAAALALAREIDSSETSAAAKASCVRQLRMTLDDLRQAAARLKLEQLRESAKSEPAEKKSEPEDRVVDITNRRKARRAGRTDS